MTYPSKGILLAAVLATLLIPAFAEAKISVNPDFEGTLLITFPDGKVQMYDPGEALPEIPSGSSIELFGGKMVVSTDAGDSLKLSLLGTEAQVAGNSSIAVSSGESDGKLSVVKGSLQVTQADGSQKGVPEGEEYTVTSNEGTDSVPATSEGAPLGTPAEDVNPPDSRSMEASPAQ